jgi:prophage DNA circulation protein
MGWTEKISEGRYTAPSGKEAVFACETTNRETELKTGVFTFPGKNGALVQHQGMGARSFPLDCVFYGADCMDEADDFEALLVEQGVGELQHPVYGVTKVVPTDSFVRSDDLVSGLNQAIVSVTFTETLADEEAELSPVSMDEIDAEYAAFEDAAAEDFASGLDTDDIEEQRAIQSALEDQTQAVNDSLAPLAATDKKTFADWLASMNELKDKIKNLYKKAASAAAKVESVYRKGMDIARLTLRVIRTPARIATSVSEKIRGYSALTTQLFSLYRNDPFGSRKIRNAYRVSRCALTGTVGSIASGTADGIAKGDGK